MTDHGAEARYRANLQGEVDSAALYRALSQAESDPRLKEVYGRLAAVEEAHAEYWRKQLDRIGVHAVRLGLGWRTRALAWLARRFGPQFVLPAVNKLEQRDVGQYDAQAAAVAEKTILLTGLAGLVAGACSMAMGEWLSVNSARELAQKQIAIEKAELEHAPEEEIEELALIYEAKGLPPEQAGSLARQMMANREIALDTLVREELGIDPDELGGSAWTAGGSSFLLFAFGAVFPG